MEYSKRLIEVDLPIRAISEHARRDKNKPKGHLHRMHVWWATQAQDFGGSAENSEQALLPLGLEDVHEALGWIESRDGQVPGSELGE